MKRKYRCDYSSDCDSDDDANPRKRFAQQQSRVEKPRSDNIIQLNTLYNEIGTLKRMIQDLQKLLTPAPACKPKTAVCSYIA